MRADIERAIAQLSGKLQRDMRSGAQEPLKVSWLPSAW